MRYVALCLLALVPARRAESVLDLTLARAAAYVRSYHQDFSVLVADEHYVQRSAVPLRSGGGRWVLEGTSDHAEERTMRSEFMLVRGGAHADPHTDRRQRRGTVIIAALKPRHGSSGRLIGGDFIFQLRGHVTTVQICL